MKVKSGANARKPRPRAIAAAAAVIPLCGLGWLAYSFFSIDVYVERSPAEPGSKQALASPLATLGRAKTPRGADLILRRLTPGRSSLPSSGPTAWTEAAASRTILGPERIYALTEGVKVFAAAAEPLGILHNTRITREARAEPPSTWETLWAFPAKDATAERPPLAIAGGDPLALTHALIYITEALGDARNAKAALAALWANPAAGVGGDGALAADHPFRPAVEWLRSLSAKGELQPDWLEMGNDELWASVRDGRARAALALYGMKRRRPQPESFDLEWLPLPARPGRKSYSVCAVILSAEIPDTAWNKAGARSTALRLLGDEDQELLGRGLSLAPVGTGVPNFDRETRDARIGLSGAPVFALPAREEDLPEGWAEMLSEVRKELGR